MKWRVVPSRTKWSRRGLKLKLAETKLKCAGKGYDWLYCVLYYFYWYCWMKNVIIITVIKFWIPVGKSKRNCSKIPYPNKNMISIVLAPPKAGHRAIWNANDANRISSIVMCVAFLKFMYSTFFFLCTPFI